VIDFYEMSKRQREWMNRMPPMPFQADWDVRAIPPFGGAMVRYKIAKGKATVSVYMDAYDELGSMGEPYWEIYPSKDGETDRFLLAETEELIAAIGASLDARP
jgi:hypothetical protein